MNYHQQIQLIAIGSAKCELMCLKARHAQASLYTRNNDMMLECRLLEAQIKALEDFLDTATV